MLVLIVEGDFPSIREPITSLVGSKSKDKLTLRNMLHESHTSTYHKSKRNSSFFNFFNPPLSLLKTCVQLSFEWHSTSNLLVSTLLECLIKI